MNVVDFIDDDNSCVAHGVLLVLRGNVPFGNHVAGVSHFVPERHGVSRDKTDHRFFYFQIFVTAARFINLTGNRTVCRTKNRIYITGFKTVFKIGFL